MLAGNEFVRTDRNYNKYRLSYRVIDCEIGWGRCFRFPVPIAFRYLYYIIHPHSIFMYFSSHSFSSSVLFLLLCENNHLLFITFIYTWIKCFLNSLNASNAILWIPNPMNRNVHISPKMHMETLCVCVYIEYCFSIFCWPFSSFIFDNAINIFCSFHFLFPFCSFPPAVALTE